jgi:pimeloyl-ACP methyl ester carboxylesterase
MTATTLETPATRTLTLDDGLTLGYRELGSGPAVLLLHGWPTSSFLWRGVMPAIARRNRVVALDLPGFGASDKPVDVRYDFDLFERAIDGALEGLGIDRVGLAGHDLGGPIALHWALGRQERVTAVALLNTLVYPEFSQEVLDFVVALSTPESRESLVSPEGLAEVVRLGLADKSVASDEVLAGVQAPFASDEARLALARAGIGLDPEGFVRIARGLPALEVPVRVVYGEHDRVLPDVAETMARVKRDLPQTEVTALPCCGHLLQEEQPERVGSLLASFYALD